MNLIPDQPGTSPNYWCTWNAQHPMWYIPTEEALSAFDFYKATEGGNAARAAMSEYALLQSPGWATHYWQAERGDLYLCLDDGWDVPFNIDTAAERSRFGSLILNEKRFPSFGGRPAMRLGRLNQHLKALGWRGLAIWVASQCVGDGQGGQKASAQECEVYWRQRMKWSAEAGVEYWKVDWGMRQHDLEFRRMLTRLAHEEFPCLRIEHAWCMPPVNHIPGDGHFRNDPLYFVPSLQVLNFSDVFRSYDVIAEIGLSSTLDRIAAWVTAFQLEGSAEGLINCEDEPYLGAAMGFTLGIMRVPIRGPYTSWTWPRIDEVRRALRWQRIAPAFGLSANSFFVSSQQLCDSYRVSSDFYYDVIAGKEIQQCAPAVLSRGMPLPKVHLLGEQPYVVAARNTNGTTAVAALPRCCQSQRITPLADVEIELADLSQPVAIFGKFRSLTFRLPSSVKIQRIWAQDLLANQAVEITAQVRGGEGALILDGTLIDEIGRQAASLADPSDPGLVLGFELF